MVFLPDHDIYQSDWANQIGGLFLHGNHVSESPPEFIGCHRLWDDAGGLFALVIVVSVLLLLALIRRRKFYADLACGIIAVLAAGGLVVAMTAVGLSHLLDIVRNNRPPTPIVFACILALASLGIFYVILTLVIYKRQKKDKTKHTPPLARASIRSA